MRPTFLTAQRFLSARCVKLFVVGVSARTAERLLWANAAFHLLAPEGRPWMAAAGALAASFVRGVARSLSAKDVRERIALSLAHAPFEAEDEVNGDGADEREATIFDARYAAERVLTVDLPTIVAESLSWSVLAVVAATIRPAVSLISLAVGACLAFAYSARLLAERNSEKAWQMNVKVADGLLVGFSARAELLANGCDQQHLAQLHKDVASWSAKAQAEELRGAVFGRFPAGLILLFVLAWSRTRWFHLSDLPLAAALVAPLASFARAFIDLRQSRPKLEALHRALQGRTSPIVGRAVVARPCPIVFDGVSYVYSRAGAAAPALTAISFVWRPGAVLVISGSNGAGKTTLLKLLAGLSRPTSGTIEVDGVELGTVDVAAWRRDLAYLAQTPFVSDKLSVRQTLALTTPELTDDVYQRQLERLEVWHVLQAKQPADPLSVQMRALSAGERQRVFIARMLAKRASLVLLDEPDEALDARGKHLLYDILEEMSATAMVAVVSHDETLRLPPRSLRLRL